VATLPASDAKRELDEITLARARGGDPAAFEALVRHYQDAVFALLWRVLARRAQRALVEDLAQETFLAAYRALPRFASDGPARLSTWLLTIATRVALKSLRGPRPIGPMAEALEDLLAAPERTDAALETRQLAAEVRAALDGLSRHHRAILILREYHELDYVEIARALEIDVGTVKSRLARARAALKRALEESR
jgi:RNA polymerase sigma-70 factor (ECF subfamily)